VAARSLGSLLIKPNLSRGGEKLYEKIPEGMAVVFAAREQLYPLKFRQAPDFYYLTGIEEAGAILVMMGPTKRTFLFAARRSEPVIRLTVQASGSSTNEKKSTASQE